MLCAHNMPPSPLFFLFSSPTVTLVPWVATSYQLKTRKMTHAAQSKNHHTLGATHLKCESPSHSVMYNSCVHVYNSSVTCQAPLSIGFLRQEYWSGLPFPSPLTQGSHLGLLHCRQTPYCLSHQGSPSHLDFT